MQGFWVPVLAAAVVLAIAGTAKLARPRPAAIALTQAGLPSSTLLVSLIGIGELLLAVAVVVWTWPAAVGLLGLAYLAFAVFCVVLVKRGGADTSCGCFGAANTPVHPLHIVLNVAVGSTILVAAFAQLPGLSDVSIMVLLVGVLGAVALLMALTLLPETLVAARPRGDGRVSK